MSATSGGLTVYTSHPHGRASATDAPTTDRDVPAFNKITEAVYRVQQSIDVLQSPGGDAADLMPYPPELVQAMLRALIVSLDRARAHATRHLNASARPSQTGLAPPTTPTRSDGGPTPRVASSSSS